MDAIVVRPLGPSDVESIIDIDARVTGTRRAGWWRGHLAPYLPSGEPIARSLIPELCQVATRAGRVVGFAIGDVQSWQFGLHRSGRIVAIGVDPSHRDSGVGRRLVEGLLDQFRKMELGEVRCIVRPGDDLDRFFSRCGFGPSAFEIRTIDLDRGQDD